MLGFADERMGRPMRLVYPTHKQVHTLQAWLGLCCEVYNAALDERKSAYRMAGISLSYESQCAELPGCKRVRPELGGGAIASAARCSETSGPGIR
ncbi:helix-turn-helix domain-containing protein [Ktedonobacter racemifer]|uniref:helix-turn-helix domain-containing protein n=1 Tax=Ktedonobacter racemifer TaxID=363277 RepID=UPI001FCC91BC|nr:helix-turn-helix domain-containing protein [Ktedonobacter racemifer]